MSKYPEVQVQALQDFNMPISKAIAILMELQRRHGKNAIVKTDAGANNVSIFVEPTKAPVTRCKKCRSLTRIKPDGTMSVHSYRDGHIRWVRCYASGMMP